MLNWLAFAAVMTVLAVVIADVVFNVWKRWP